MDTVACLAGLVFVAGAGNVEIVEGETPEGGVETAAELLPHLRRVEGAGGFHHRVNHMLTGQVVVCLRGMETNGRVQVMLDEVIGGMNPQMAEYLQHYHLETASKASTSRMYSHYPHTTNSLL